MTCQSWADAVVGQPQTVGKTLAFYLRFKFIEKEERAFSDVKPLCCVILFECEP